MVALTINRYHGYVDTADASVNALFSVQVKLKFPSVLSVQVNFFIARLRDCQVTPCCFREYV